MYFFYWFLVTWSNVFEDEGVMQSVHFDIFVIRLITLHLIGKTTTENKLGSVSSFSLKGNQPIDFTMHNYMLSCIILFILTGFFLLYHTVLF